MMDIHAGLCNDDALPGCAVRRYTFRYSNK